MGLVHAFVSVKPPAPDPTIVDGPKWNDTHRFTGANLGALLYRDAADLIQGLGSATGVLRCTAPGAVPFWDPTIDTTELGYLDGVTPGVVTASKAVVVDANKDIASFRNLTMVKLVASGTGPHVFGAAAGDPTIGLRVNVAASGTFACNMQLGGTLTAQANADVMAAFNLAGPSVAKGAFTGLTAVGLRLFGSNMSATGTGTIAAAYTLFIGDAPTIATTNYALWVNSGVSRFGGTVEHGANITFTANATYAIGTSAVVAAAIYSRILQSDPGQNLYLAGPGGIYFRLNAVDLWAFNSVGTLYPVNDAANQIGNTANRVTSIYLSTAVVIGANPSTSGDVRIRHTAIGMAGRNSANTANRAIIDWGNTNTDVLTLGDPLNGRTQIIGGDIKLISPGGVDIQNGLVSQSLRIYSTYTDAGNNQGLTLRFSGAGGEARIQTFALGTGTTTALALGAGAEHWRITASGHFTAGVNNTYDIGGGSTRPRSVYIGTALGIGTATPGAVQGDISLGSDAEGLRITHNFTLGDTTIYERYPGGALIFGASNVSTGHWKIPQSGHWHAVVDNTYDIGAVAANRPRIVYAATGLISGDSVTALTTVVGASFKFSGGSRMLSGGDGVIRLSNDAITDFSRLCFGGTSAAFPALRRGGTGLEVVTADGSAWTTLQLSTLYATGVAISGAGVLTIGTNPASTGAIRLANNVGIYARNTANTGDAHLISLNTSAPGQILVGVTGYHTIVSGYQLRLHSEGMASAASPVNGDWWVDCTGTSPARICALRVYDGGAIRTLASFTY